MDENDTETMQHQGVSVLIVDDDEYFQKFLSRQLRDIGVQRVSAALSGADALAQLSRQEHPDVVFCDLRMPTMDGIELLQQLNLEGYAGSVALISGEDERVLNSVAELVRAYRWPLLGALSKPVATAELEQLLRRWRPPLEPGSAANGAAGRVPDAETLRAALHDGAIEVHLQPIVELPGGRVVGVEALARWFDAQGEEIPAGGFTALAERSGLAGSLTLAVLRTAMRELAPWPDWSLSVNVYAEDLASTSLPEQLRSIADAAGFSLDRLILDVHENPLNDDAQHHVLEVSNRLSLQHVGLAVDGGGVGYAELESLLRLPFSEFKIDGDFLRGAHARDKAAAILAAHVRLVQGFGLRVVAEGVSEQADWDLAVSCGCDRAQGHYIAPAMPASALRLWADWYADRSPGPP